MKHVSSLISLVVLSLVLSSCTSPAQSQPSQPRPVYEEPSSSSFWQPEDVERNKQQ